MDHAKQDDLAGAYRRLLSSASIIWSSVKFTPLFNS